MGVDLVLSEPAPFGFTVDFATSPGTATEDVDYQSGAGTITFVTGQSSAAIPITIINDTLQEPPETFFITISNPGNLSVINWKVRIGISFANLETTWTVYNRFPRIGNSFAFQGQEIQIANPFGGGLYIEIPDGSSVGEVTLNVQGAVEMPTYALAGHTGLNQSVSKFLADVDKADVPYFAEPHRWSIA